MPGRSQPSEADAELVELRVLDGPNRFFTRPAVKLEFAAQRAGAAQNVARLAGDEVVSLHLELGMPAPELTVRDSSDGLRATVAFPWRRRTISQAIGAAAARLAVHDSARWRELYDLRAMAPGPLPRLPAQHFPIVAVTGTNGKSTTTRLIAHVASAAGMAVGMTNSDGIHLRGRLVEAGDWTGFGGARRVLSEPSLDLAVLETARGGILLRGIGYAHNDVAVVTNISADHLGLQGIDTLDELAEVKSSIVRITRRGGWAVLNGEDRRVWEMRHLTRAHRYAFALDPDAPAVAQALRGGGRAAVLVNGWVELRKTAAPPCRLVEVAELPVTLGGLSRHNVANVLAASAACDAIGLPPAEIARGLRMFRADARSNPGRLNLLERQGIAVLVDFAHNEAGLRGLLDVARGLADRNGGRVLLALGTAGDRTDDVLRSLGEIAARGADEVLIVEKHHYLRGRDPEAMNELFRTGLRAGGVSAAVGVRGSEVEGLQELVGRARDGDVVALMTHAEREDVFAWLEREGFRPATTRR
jgi:cyanophycin synthetase